MAAEINRKTRVCTTNIYLCQSCDKTFLVLDTSELRCPQCGATGKYNVAPIYVTEDLEKDAMYTKIDWHEGD